MLQQLENKQGISVQTQEQVLGLIQSLLVEKAPREYVLRLDKQHIDTIRETFHSVSGKRQLKNITSIVLYNCQLVSTDVLTPFSFPQLRSAQLHVNKLTCFDVSILGSESLAFLDLSVNELTKVQGFGRQTSQHLKYLNLKKNKLEDLDSFAGLQFPSLKQLNLANNSIKTIKHLASLQFQQLAVLELGNNRITSLQSLYQTPLSSLTRLCLNHNLISNLRTLSKCLMPQLKHLDLSGNFISELTRLEQLSVREGKINNLIISFNTIADITALTKFIRKRTLKHEYFSFVAQCTHAIENGVLLQQFQDAK